MKPPTKRGRRTTPDPVVEYRRPYRRHHTPKRVFVGIDHSPDGGAVTGYVPVTAPTLKHSPLESLNDYLPRPDDTGE